MKYCERCFFFVFRFCVSFSCTVFIIYIGLRNELYNFRNRCFTIRIVVKHSAHSQTQYGFVPSIRTKHVRLPCRKKGMYSEHVFAVIVCTIITFNHFMFQRGMSSLTDIQNGSNKVTMLISNKNQPDVAELLK